MKSLPQDEHGHQTLVGGLRPHQQDRLLQPPMSRQINCFTASPGPWRSGGPYTQRCLRRSQSIFRIPRDNRIRIGQDSDRAGASRSRTAGTSRRICSSLPPSTSTGGAAARPNFDVGMSVILGAHRITRDSAVADSFLLHLAPLRSARRARATAMWQSSK